MSLIPVFSEMFDDELFGTPICPLYPPMPLMRRLESTANSTLRLSSPCYEIHEDETKFQLSVKVPGVKLEDMAIEVEQSDRILRLAGGRKVEKENEVIETRFEKSFRLPSNIDTSNIQANLADGILIVTAHKDAAKKDDPVNIPITYNKVGRINNPAA